jgi:hypothetical protein
MRRRKNITVERVQGLLFSQSEMEQMLKTQPLPAFNELSEVEISNITGWEILETAIRDTLQCAGCGDPGVLENFMGLLSMCAYDSS